jgi:preprotein translocase subunit SecE
LVEHWSPKPGAGSSSLSTRARINNMSRIVEIWKETTDELANKVTWPTWEELRSSTTIVVIASILFAIVILLIDKAFGGIMDILYSFLEESK